MELLTIGQAAERLQIGRSLLYRFVQRGEISSLRLGRRRLILASSLEEFVARQLEEQLDADTTARQTSGGHHE